MKRDATAKGYTLVELLVTLAIAGLIGAAIVGVYRVSQNVYIRASSLEAAQDGARAGLDRMANELRLVGSYWVGAAAVTDPTAIINPTPNSITFMANVDDSSIVGGAEATATALTANTVTLSLSAADAGFRVYQNAALNDWIYIANGARRDVKQLSTSNGSTLTLNMNTGNLNVSNLGLTYPVGSLVRDVKTITYTRNPAATSTCPPLTCLTRQQGGDNPDPVVDNVSGLTFTYFDGSNPPVNLGATPPVTSISAIQINLRVQSPDGSARLLTTRVRPRNLP